MQDCSKRQLLIAQVEQIAFDHLDRSGVSAKVVYRLGEADGGYHGPEVTVSLVLPLGLETSMREIERQFLAAGRDVLARICSLPGADIIARMEDPIGIDALMSPEGQ